MTPALAVYPRSLQQVREELAERRMRLLVQQINARAEAKWCERELAAIERRLEMIAEAMG